MRFPSIFLNHGGGPMPLLGNQPNIVQHFIDVRTNWIDRFYPKKPKAIIIISAHYETDPIEIMSSPNPSMYYDYYGFPPESYTIQYPAPGSPTLAKKIHNLLTANGIESKLNPNRGYDHGMFVPLKLMYPEADIPIVGISIHNSLDVDINIKLGETLEQLRTSTDDDNNDDDDDDGIMIIGSGFTFHNIRAFFNPTRNSEKQAQDFNDWLKESILGGTSSNGDSSSATCSATSSNTSSTSIGTSSNYDTMRKQFKVWKTAPGAKFCHPREEHLIPLFVAAGAGGKNGIPQLIYNQQSRNGNHAMTGYMFQ